jgi:hypothetical protein
MDTLDVIFPLNGYLSVKSSSRLKCVSKFFKMYIIVKEYSFYRIFKQLNITTELIIETLFESDKNFVNREAEEIYYYPIKKHKHGLNIKEYVKKSSYRWCIFDFAETLVTNDDPDYFIHDMISHHCQVYTEYSPLQGLLYELCCEEYI